MNKQALKSNSSDKLNYDGLNIDIDQLFLEFCEKEREKRLLKQKQEEKYINILIY